MSDETPAGSVVHPARRPHALNGAMAVVFADLDAAFSALEDVERGTPRLAAGQIARFQDLTARGNKDARHWRAAHIALRIVLERYAGVAVRGVSYTIAPGGRPHLVALRDVPHPPHFSLSHTGAFALIAVSPSQPVGVDLEVPRVVSIAPERRQRIETAALRLAEGEMLAGDGDARFLQAWVRLEAAAKATGEGIGRVLTKAGAIGKGRLAGHPSDEAASAVAAVCVRDLALGSGFFGAVAARTLPPLLMVEALPTTAAGLAAFVTGRNIAHSIREIDRT